MVTNYLSRTILMASRSYGIVRTLMLGCCSRIVVFKSKYRLVAADAPATLSVSVPAAGAVLVAASAMSV